MAVKVFIFAMTVAACATGAYAAQQREAAYMTARANPVRKVVGMLQAMSKKVEEEGKKEEELFEKFMCYCKSGGGALEKSIADNEAKVGELPTNIEEAEGKHKQLEEDIKQHRTDRDAAKAAMAEATALREKEAAEFATFKEESETNIGGLSKAVAAIEKGMKGAFLQTSAAQLVRKLVNSNQDMADLDRQNILSFLSADQSDEYSPASGEITGILNQMLDEMKHALAEAVATEDAAVKSYEEVIDAKTKEVNGATEAIEVKTARVGELAVEIVQMKNDLEETEKALVEDKKFLADLAKQCKTKAAEWDERQKMRNEELLALADTIKILNDDDALELFKKTLPSSASSFMQIQESSTAMRARALKMLEKGSRPGRSVHLDFIGLAIRGKKIGFDKVIKMIDDMVALLKKEQADDDNKKEDCEMQLDKAEDDKKALERGIGDLETEIADLEEGIDSVTSELAGLKDGIKHLDKQVAEATEQRREENKEYTEMLASSSAAKELLGFAKNRLNKFYNPSQYKEPPAAALPQTKADPGAPPETFSGDYKKSGESTGVIAMIDLLIRDLDKDITEAKAEEKNAQEDYEKYTADAKAQRQEDSNMITEKAAAQADMEVDLKNGRESKKSKGKELTATKEFIHSLHVDCDFLLKYFDVRKEARSSEIDALGKAKAVLSGADYSLLQAKATRRHLRA